LFVQFKMATNNKKNKQVNLRYKPKMRFDISPPQKKRIHNIIHMNHKEM